MTLARRLVAPRPGEAGGLAATVSADGAFRRPTPAVWTWLRPAAAALLPGAAIIVFQMVVYPMPFGVGLQGLIIGALGSLVAVGMALVYRANRILNFAQVDLGLAPTVLTVSLIVYSSVNYFLAVAIGLVGAILVGSLIELVVIRRFFNSARLILTVATIGVSQLLVAGALFVPLIWGQQPTASVVHIPISFTFSVFPLVFTADHLAALIVAPLALLGVAVLLRFTNIGVAIRASAERAERASMLGVPVKRLQTVVWAVASALSFVAVLLQAGILGLPVDFSLSLTVLLGALGAMALGDMVRLPTIAVTALALGVLQQAVIWDNPNNPDLVDVVFAGVVVVGLLLRRRRTSRVESGAVMSWTAADEVRPVPPELRALPEVRAVRYGGGLIVAGALAALPWLLSSNAGNQLKATAVVVFVVITLSVVVLTGWAGQVTLGQMAFAAVGGALGAYATQTWRLDLSLALLIAGGAGAATATVVSVPTLRLRGFFPAVTTLAFAIAASNYLLNPQFFSWVPVERVVRPKLFGVVNLNSQPAYYYFCLACLALIVFALRGVRRSRTGRVLMALRENEQGAQSFGVSVVRAKLTAFALSGFIAGVGGCLLVHLLQAFDPDTFGPDQSFLVFTTAVVGGLGSLLGAGLGTGYLQGGQWFLPGANWQALVSALGVLFVLMVIPGGLSDITFRIRDALLRLVADRRGIVAPSLFTSVGRGGGITPAEVFGAGAGADAAGSNGDSAEAVPAALAGSVGEERP